jgi:hypothetical protein
MAAEETNEMRAATVNRDKGEQLTRRQVDLDHLAARRERLNPELVDYLSESPFGLILSHPLVHRVGVHPDRAGIVNSCYREKLKAIDQAVAKGQWSKFVDLHERPYRLDAFMEIAEHLPDKKFWVLLAYVWTDSENIWQNLQHWRALWNTERPGKQFAMDAKERKEFKQLPDKITIYRGISNGHTAKGMSWTLDREKAIWFAKRFQNSCTPPILLRARANKSDVHAMVLGRKETEIVIERFKIVARKNVT